MTQARAIHVGSEAEMIALGRSLAGQAAPGTVIGLIGPLGGGKTTLVRGFLRGLGYEGDIQSPTFTLITEYKTTPPVCHADLYRLNSKADIMELGLQDYIETHVVIIEWAERAEDLLPKDATIITIEFSDGGRRVTIGGMG